MARMSHRSRFAVMGVDHPDAVSAQHAALDREPHHRIDKCGVDVRQNSNPSLSERNALLFVIISASAITGARLVDVTSKHLPGLERHKTP
jgi:hypothetical protein